MKFKKCLGFEEAICHTCKRFDKTADRLVTTLAIDPVTKYKKCQYYL